MQARRFVRQVASAALSPRSISSTASKTKFPSDRHIIQAFRRGDYDSAISNFAKRPVHLRSSPLCEAAIIACAQIPDAAAAQAVFNVMQIPTQSAMTALITAWCRERNVSAAADVLESATKYGLQIDPSIAVYVSRVAHRFKQLDVVSRVSNLKLSVSSTSSKRSSLNTSSFFINDKDGETYSEGNLGQDTQLSLQAIESEAEPCSAIALYTRDAKVMRAVASAEQQVKAAGSNAGKVYEEWLSISEDDNLRREIGVLSAVVSKLASCPGQTGGPLAVNTLMTWIRAELYDPSSQRGKIFYTNRPNVIALLLTSVTSALAAAAPISPRLALSAYDALSSLQLPGFSRSLPLTGAYLKILQHAQLSLSATQDRINRAWGQHIQFDEWAFSMALGALLKSQAPVTEKLRTARDWVSTGIRAAGIPLTVHTYNLLAGQVRYARDARLVSDLLSDMRDANVQPTALTYGLIFGVCNIQGEYNQRDRRKALPVQLWMRVLNGILDHMDRAGVAHTAYSRLSLAKSYAHLGETRLAMQEFDQFISLSTMEDTVIDEIEDRGFGSPYRYKATPSVSLKDHKSNSGMDLDYRFSSAFHNVMYHLAHARECSPDCVDEILALCRKLEDHGLSPGAPALDALSVACVRAGRMKDIAEVTHDLVLSARNRSIFESASAHSSGRATATTKGMSMTGMKHLLQAIGHAPDARAWYDGGLRHIIFSQDVELLRSNGLASSVRAVVLQFARAGLREVCEDIINVTGVTVHDLEDVYEGREFSALRVGMKRTVSDSQRSDQPNHDLSLTRGKISTSKRKECSNPNRSMPRSSVVDHTVVPLT